MSEKDTLSSLLHEVSGDLQKNILPFWVAMTDVEHGGFYGLLTHNGVLQKSAVWAETCWLTFDRDQMEPYRMKYGAYLERWKLGWKAIKNRSLASMVGALGQNSAMYP